MKTGRNCALPRNQQAIFSMSSTTSGGRSAPVLFWYFARTAFAKAPADGTPLGGAIDSPAPATITKRSALASASRSVRTGSMAAGIFGSMSGAGRTGGSYTTGRTHRVRDYRRAWRVMRERERN